MSTANKPSTPAIQADGRSTKALQDNISIAVLSGMLVASNVVAFWMVNHYTDVIGRALF